MNKKILLPLLSIILLACSITAPFTAATPITQVVFRSPREMNLQSMDVPDLTETNVEVPATEALLPETIDQDQRAYTNQTQNVYIQSNAIMVAEKPSLTTGEIINHVVRRNRPEIVVLNTERVQIGEIGEMFPVNGYCSNAHNAGYILVVRRNNMVIVLIACGSEVTRDDVLRWGQIIDGHIRAPAQPSEVASSEIPAPTPTALPVTNTETPTPAPLLDPYGCDSPNLTPEEKANCGVHLYTFLYTIHATIDKCHFEETNQLTNSGEKTLTITFSNIGFTRCSEEDCLEYQKTGVNSYLRQYSLGSVTQTLFLTFTLDGIYEDKPDSYCPVTFEFFLAK